MKRSAVLFLLSAAAAAAENPWQKLAPLPQPNDGFACGIADGQIVVIGGTNWEGGRKNWLKGVDRLDPATLLWKPLPSLDRPLAYALTGTIGNRLIVTGGSTGRSPFPGTITVEGGRVTVGPDRGIELPVLCAGGLVGDDFVLAGGTDDAANVQGFRRKTFAWNVSTGESRVLSPYPGPAFGAAGSAIAGDELLVFGGCIWDPKTQSIANFPESYAYSLSRNSWRRLSPLPDAVRGIAAVRLDGDHWYLAGGYQGDAEGFVDRAFVYSAAEDRYRPAAPLPYRAAVVLVGVGGYAYCIGGEDGIKHRSDSVYRARLSELIHENHQD